MTGPALTRPFDILLIEDEPATVRLVTEALRDHPPPNRLHHAANGVAALDFLRQKGAAVAAPRPALILLDLHLPGLDGQTILETIKTDALLRRIPLVVFTSSPAEHDIVACYQRYANAVVLKPIELDAFLTTVRAIVSFWLSIAVRPPV